MLQYGRIVEEHLSSGVSVASSSFHRPAEVPPEIAFIAIPKALAQFHHLPLHVPVWLHKQDEVKKNGYDFKDAMGVMETLLVEAPQVPGAYLYQLFVKKWPKLMEVNAYFASNRIAEAIPKLVSILEIDPECPLTCFQLGYCFRATGELEKSESFYRQALRMAPDAGWIYSNLGRTCLAMGDKAKAVEAFWKALELMPGDHFVLEQLVGLRELYVLASGGEDEDSSLFVKRTDYEKKMLGLLKKENAPGKLLGLGWKLLQDHLVDLACQCFEKAHQAEPAPEEALLGLGIAHLEAGRTKEAEHYLVEYLDLNPGSATGHLNLFKAYLAQDEMDLAWEEIQTAVSLEPDRSDTLRQLFHLFRETDREEEGLEWMEKLAQENQDSFAPLLIRAQAFAQNDQWDKAESDLREALKRSPHNEEALLYYTSELGKRGLKEDLIQLVLAEPKPLPLSLTINLALAYSQTGRIEEGRKTLMEFLDRPGIQRLEKIRAEAILKEFEK
jgi:tetratricopeptide (TPR) repeat protein